MDFQVKFKVNEKVYSRDPEGSELGKRIVKSAIDLIYELDERKAPISCELNVRGCN